MRGGRGGKREKLRQESEWRGGRTRPGSERLPGGRSPGGVLGALSSVEVSPHCAIRAPSTHATRKGAPREPGHKVGVLLPPGAVEASSALGFLGSPPASPRDPGPHWSVVRRASSFLGSGFPGTHPVPTPKSWRPARDARRPGGRPAKFRVPLQETASCVPDSEKPVVWAPDSLANLSPPPTPSAWDVSAG